MPTLDELRESLPEAARDLKVNLQSVFAESALSDTQRWAVAYASAITAGYRPLAEAIRAAGALGPEAQEDAVAAGAIMGMNNVLYRFKHVLAEVGTYSRRHPRLRMQRIARTSGPKVDFELMCLAASAINGCSSCMIAHELSSRELGASEDQIWDTVRIAAVVKGAAVALG